MEKEEIEKRIWCLVIPLIILICGCSTGFVQFEEEEGIPIEELNGERRRILEEAGRWDIVKENVDRVIFVKKLIPHYDEECRGLSYTVDGVNYIKVVDDPFALGIEELSSSEKELVIAAIIYHEALHFYFDGSEGEDHKKIRPLEEELVDDFYALYPYLITEYVPQIESFDIRKDKDGAHLIVLNGMKYPQPWEPDQYVFRSEVYNNGVKVEFKGIVSKEGNCFLWEEVELFPPEVYVIPWGLKMVYLALGKEIKGQGMVYTKEIPLQVEYFQY